MSGTARVLSALALALAGCAPASSARAPEWGDRVLYHPPERVSRADPGWHEVYAPLGEGAAAEERLEVARGRLLAGAAVARTALQHGRATPAAARFLDEVDWDRGAIDLGEMYERLPSSDGEARSVELVGRLLEDGRYVVDLASGAVAPPPGSGSALLAVRVAPARFEGRPTYRLLASLAIDTGEYSGQGAAEVVAGVLRRFARPEAAGAEARLADEAAQARLGPEDRSTLGSLQSSFPRTVRAFLNVFTLEDLVEPGVGLHLVQTRSGELARRFPHLDRYLDRLGDLASIRAAAGEDRVSLDTRDLRVEARATPPGSPGGARHRGLASLDARAAGLVLRVHDLPFDLDTRPGAGGARLELVLDRMPRDMGVEGKALGIVDRSAIEALAGLDFDRMLRDFLVVLLRGNDGRGTRLAVEWREHVLEARLSTELAANRAVGTGRRIYASRYAPEDEVAGEIREIAIALLESFALDLEEFGR